jgi:hypothetical protein
MNGYELHSDTELEFDIDVEAPLELDPPWADEADVVELSAHAAAIVEPL